MTDNFNYEELEGLSPLEKQVALNILKELSTNGNSDTFNALILQDYHELPVDIITFIKDPKYLGKAWHTSEGKCKLFPYWEEKLKILFPDPYTTDYNNFIESGARGLGKSEIAVTCGLYLMHRAMCLKHPLEYYNLKPTEKLAFAFMNITEALAMDIGISKFQATVKLSPWFLERGTLTGRTELLWNPPDFINIIIGSLPRHVIGQPILFAFFDEISFIANQDIEKQKQKALDMIDTAIGGMKTRFLNNGKSPALLVLASSKRSEKSFLEVHMKKKLETEGENTFIVDEPVWNIRPASEYSGRRFFVGQGNKFLASVVIPDVDDDKLQEYRNRGYNVISVPVEYKANFLEDIDRALCDYAGVSSSELTKYINASRLADIKNKNIQNLFIQDEIEVGNDPNDTTQYFDFIDLDRVPPRMKSMPMYIHLDMSISGDATGIAGVWIKGKRPSVDNSQTRDLYYQTAFNISIKAPKGYQVSFAKNRELIYWLKRLGFVIKGISSDTYQNAALGQDFLAAGYDYKVISVDRVNTDKICEPYAYFKNTIYEKRLIMYDSNILTNEILDLERNGNTGKIDHPEHGRKDASDAICGAIYNASAHGDEFDFEYGEDLEIGTQVSGERSYSDKRQIEVDMEAILNELHDPLQNRVKNQIKQDEDYFINFGMGAAKPLANNNIYYLDQGIII